MANKTITQLDAAQSLNDNMVIAVQDTNTTYKTTLADVKAYCGAAPAGDKYQIGDRVTDDSNNDIGMVSGFFTDANDQKYAVVCLNAVDRLAIGDYLSSPTNVTGIPQYQNQTVWSAPETATTNTTAILATGSSEACGHCRSKSYTIDGASYAGQLPNLKELVDILSMRTKINTDDPTATQYSSLVIPNSTNAWSSTQQAQNYGWCVFSDGVASNRYQNYRNFVIPVLELPLEG